MFKFRNLLGVGIAMVMMALMTGWAAAQPAQQGTVTPEPTTPPIDTPVPTIAATEPTTATGTVTGTSVAPAVSPLATPVGTPSTLPTTGASDDRAGAFSLVLIAAGAVILIGILGLSLSRRPH